MVLNKYKYKEEDEDTGKDSSAISHGYLIRQKYRGYFTKSNTIKKAQATDPQDFDNVNYNVEPIWDILNRKAEYLYVANDESVGGEILYVIVSHRGWMEFSPELPIPPQQAAELEYVYQVRLRSAKIGHQYRLSEQPLKPL